MQSAAGGELVSEGRARRMRKVRAALLSSTALNAALLAGAVALIVATPGAALAACTPASAIKVTAACTGLTTNQGGGAPGTSARFDGYGTGIEAGVTVNVAVSSTVTGTFSGIFLDDLTLTNNAGASIAGGVNGIYANHSANVTNSGSIAGTAFAGISAGFNATVTNNVGASITGGRYGILANTPGAANVANSGSIVGGLNGIEAANNVTVTNNAGASITGGQYGIVADFTGGSSVFNAGSISGGTAAISFAGTGNTLTLAPGSVITGNVLGTGSDTFQLGGSGSATFDVSQIGAAAQYQGFGTFNKIGTSSWTLTGSNSAALPWTISAGTLLVNGTLANSTMTVNAGGTLGGTGTVGATQVNNGGTFAAGSGVAGSSMTVAGNLAFASGALYLVQIDPAAASLANVTGNATLAGSVQAVLAPGSYMTRSYDILHAAGGLGGTAFNGVSGNTPNFGVSLSYSTTDVFLNLSASLGGGTPLNANQQNVAGAINGFFNNGGALPPNFANLFGLTGGNLANALTLVSGEAATGAQQGAFQLGSQFLAVTLDPFVDGRAGVGGADGPALGFAPEREALPEDIALAYAKITKAPEYKVPPVTFEPRWTAWGAAYGGYNRTSGDPLVVGSHDLTARVAGVAAGLDHHVTRDTVVGFALAGGGTNWTLAQGLGGGRSDAFQAGAYAATRSGPAYLAASLAFTNHWMSTDRFAAFGDHLTASFNAQSVGARAETGYRFGLPAFGIAPYAAVQAQSFRTPTYSETDVTGGGFALTNSARTATDTRSELGARFDHVAAVVPTAVLTLRARLAWAHDWVSDPSLAAVFQALPGASFVANGALPMKDSALASAGAELKLPNGVTLLGKFDGELAAHAQTYAGTGTLRWAW